MVLALRNDNSCENGDLRGDRDDACIDAADQAVSRADRHAVSVLRQDSRVIICLSSSITTVILSPFFSLL